MVVSAGDSIQNRWQEVTASSGANELFWNDHTTLVDGAHNVFTKFGATLPLELAKQFTILGIPGLVPAAAESKVASGDDDPIEAKSPARRERSSTNDGDETLVVGKVWGCVELTFADNIDNRASIAFSIKPPIRPSKAWTTSSTIFVVDCPSLTLADADEETVVIVAIGILVAVEISKLSSDDATDAGNVSNRSRKATVPAIPC